MPLNGPGCSFCSWSHETRQADCCHLTSYFAHFVIKLKKSDRAGQENIPESYGQVSQGILPSVFVVGKENQNHCCILYECWDFPLSALGQQGETLLSKVSRNECWPGGRQLIIIIDSVLIGMACGIPRPTWSL